MQPQASASSEIGVGAPPSTETRSAIFLLFTVASYISHLPSGEHIAGVSRSPVVICLMFPPCASMRQIFILGFPSRSAEPKKMYLPSAHETGLTEAKLSLSNGTRFEPSAFIR